MIQELAAALTIMAVTVIVLRLAFPARELKAMAVALSVIAAPLAELALLNQIARFNDRSMILPFIAIGCNGAYCSLAIDVSHVLAAYVIIEIAMTRLKQRIKTSNSIPSPSTRLPR